MQVNIKDLSVAMEIKNKGIELDVSNSGGHIGDLVITRTRLTWCPGRTAPENGKKISWEDFIEFMNGR